MLSPASESPIMLANDNDFTDYDADTGSDPHCQAALVLVESLIHGLCENGTLSVSEAVAITERAVDVQHDHAVAADGAGAPIWRSHGLLSRIAGSLEADTGQGSPPRLS